MLTKYNQKRFWKKVNIPKDYKNNCWEYLGGLDKDGYGVFYLNSTSILNNIQLGKKYNLTNHTISRIRNKRHKYS